MELSSTDSLIQLIFPNPKGLEMNFGTCPVFTRLVGKCTLVAKY